MHSKRFLKRVSIQNANSKVYFPVFTDTNEKFSLKKEYERVEWIDIILHTHFIATFMRSWNFNVGELKWMAYYTAYTLFIQF